MRTEGKGDGLTIEAARPLVKDLSFVDLQTLIEVCQENAEQLRDGGVAKLAEQFEAMAEQTFGMTAKQIMAASRKRRREQEQEIEEQATNDA